jgi:nucleoside-diphosphate-sugar epimerase
MTGFRVRNHKNMSAKKSTDHFSIDKNQPVLVTGASGYIASWVVKDLLEAGFTVHATVRDIRNEDKYRHLLVLEGAGGGNLRIFEADLLREGSFAEAMAGCAGVFHTASPFRIQGVKDAQKELIGPALAGTRNVLGAVANTDTVRRVVLTSSMAAIYGDAADVMGYPDATMTEDCWNESSTPTYQSYSYSKTVAEREAWSLAAAQNRWDLVVINPGFVVGPSLTNRRDSTSIDTILSLINGRFKSGVPEIYFACVDVRDVARAHVNAWLRTASSGRHILAAEPLSMLQIASILREHCNGRYPIPTAELPAFLLYLAGPFIGFGWKYIRRNLGIPMKFDNRYSKIDLGMEFRPLRQTLLDHLGQLERDGLVG